MTLEIDTSTIKEKHELKELTELKEAQELPQKDMLVLAGGYYSGNNTNTFGQLLRLAQKK